MARKGDVTEWLESDEGQRWSRATHGVRTRDGGMGTTGVFGELKTDYEDCDWAGLPCVAEHRRGDRP